MAQISEGERAERLGAVQNAIGTHVMEDLPPDAETLAILQRYAVGALTLEQFSEEMDRYASKLARSATYVSA